MGSSKFVFSIQILNLFSSLGKIKKKVVQNSCIMCLDLLLEKHLMVTGTISKLINVWDFSSLTIIQTLNGHENSVTKIIITPTNNGLRLISAGMDSKIKIWLECPKKSAES